VLQDISHWLKEQYESENKLAGIIYLHGINHPRVEGSALRNLKMFRELCGLDALKNITLATTFWTDVNTLVGKTREEELASKQAFWGAMLQRGSRMARFVDLASGLDILRNIIGLPPQPLKIQREMVDDDKALVDTGAGQVVNEELIRLEEQHKRDISRLKTEMDEAMGSKDAEYQEILREHEKKLEERISKVQRQQEQLKADRRAEARRMQSEFEDAIYALRHKNDVDVSNLKGHVEQLQGEILRRECEHDTQARHFEEARQAQEQQMSDIQRNNHESQMLQEERIAELEFYNEQAQRKFEGLDVDDMIAQIRAEEGKLRAEDREELEAAIRKLQQGNSTRKRDQVPEMLFSVLRTVLPVATQLILGIPIVLPDIEF
jgi:hypothetical protein